VSNDSDNQANQPQSEPVAGHEMDEKSRSSQEKEGRAINFPAGALAASSPNSTLPAHMQGSVNFVTTSTEKSHVISFFDLSDVSMDHDVDANEPKKKTKVEEVEVEAKPTTTTAPEIVECSFNGTTYKVSERFTRPKQPQLESFPIAEVKTRFTHCESERGES
jgi:hypothetical protein